MWPDEAACSNMAAAKCQHGNLACCSNCLGRHGVTISASCRSSDRGARSALSDSASSPPCAVLTGADVSSV